MNHMNIILVILIALTPACMAQGSNVYCASCGRKTWEILNLESRPWCEKCGKPLEFNEGLLCDKLRTKKYYKCPNPECKAETVKNKRFPTDEQEDCIHEHKIVYKPPITAQSETGASSSGTAIHTSKIPGGGVFYHFLEEK
ncbi:hypothetical protein PGTUg99_029577 [Puccinia graminis f. sp. tritici]|uniref:Uncharacterized protein n=1 Tax=Puccinia graminis f. sp. tritici TaxID=56615 RepID=A0A5B0S8A2_PUCGR|nr:hypothetical protein PGTUg99_029577 [Puccinia graminis f. sp. tritici]